MDIAAKLRFAFDVGEFTIANMHNAANARRFAKSAWMTRKFNDRKGVNLPDAFAFGFNQDLLLKDLILHTFSEETFAPFTLLQH